MNCIKDCFIKIKFLLFSSCHPTEEAESDTQNLISQDQFELYLDEDDKELSDNSDLSIHKINYYNPSDYNIVIKENESECEFEFDDEIPENMELQEL